MKIYRCAHGCGYTADFETVTEHEASCAKNVAMATVVDSHTDDNVRTPGLRSLERTKSRLLEDDQRVHHSVGVMKLRRLYTLFRIIGVDGIKKLHEAQTTISKNWKGKQAREQFGKVVDAEKVIARTWRAREEKKK